MFGGCYSPIENFLMIRAAKGGRRKEDVNFSPSSQRRKQHQPPFLFRARPAAGGSFDRAALPRPPSAGRELAVDIAIAAPTEATHLLFTCVSKSIEAQGQVRPVFLDGTNRDYSQCSTGPTESIYINEV